MKFFRPATEADFQKGDIQFNNHHHMDEETKSFIERGQIHKARKLLRDKYGFSLVETKKYCEAYEAFVNARRDFQNGLAVYVSYYEP